MSPTYRTPVAAIWTGSILAILFTAYTPLYTTIVSVTVIFLFLSFTVPITLGVFAYNKTWTQMGRWNIGGWYKVFAILSILAMALIFVIGIQPPNDKALWITLGFLVLTAIVWFGFERNRFQGPPIGAEIEKRAAIIKQAGHLARRLQAASAGGFAPADRFEGLGSAVQHPAHRLQAASAGGFTPPERAGGLGGATQHPPAR